MLEGKLKHMLEALWKEMLEAYQPDTLDAHKIKGLSQYERYYRDPKDIFTFHAEKKNNYNSVLTKYLRSIWREKN